MRSNAPGGPARPSRVCSTSRCAYHLAGDVGAEVSAAETATALDPRSVPAWSAYAHALARTDRLVECEAACRTALRLGADAEVGQLLDRVLATQPRGLAARSAAA